MNRNTYRICLAILIMAAMIYGVFYYRLAYHKELNMKEGIFVYREPMGSGYA